MHFDLIIPCYNPSPGWEKTFVRSIIRLKSALQSRFYGSFSAILVNDGSTLNFSQAEYEYILQSGIDVRLITNKTNRGKGYSIRRAVKQSSATFCIYTDLDIPFGIDSILDILSTLYNGYDIVVGCRSRLTYYQQASFTRKIMSKSLMKVNKYLLNMPFEDTQAGIKGFNRRGKEIFLSTTINRFLFDLEFLRTASSIPEIKIKNITVTNNSSLHLTSFSFKTLFVEGINFIRILIKPKYDGRTKENFAWYRSGRI